MLNSDEEIVAGMKASLRSAGATGFEAGSCVGAWGGDGEVVVVSELAAAELEFGYAPFVLGYVFPNWSSCGRGEEEAGEGGDVEDGVHILFGCREVVVWIGWFSSEKFRALDAARGRISTLCI